MIPSVARPDYYSMNCHNFTPKANMAMHSPSITRPIATSVNETPLDFIGFSTYGTCATGSVNSRLLLPSWQSPHCSLRSPPGPRLCAADRSGEHPPPAFSTRQADDQPLASHRHTLQP